MNSRIEYLETYRIEKYMTKADMCRLLEITPQSYSNWLKGEKKPREIYIKFIQVIKEYNDIAERCAKLEHDRSFG